MILPRGITGFDVSKSSAAVDPGQFQSDCWHVVRSIPGRVVNRPQVIAPAMVNFLTAVLATPADEVTVLVNRYHPILGFCRPLEPGDCTLDFLDPPRLAPAFESLGRYTVLSRAEVDQIVMEAMCQALGHAERQQLAYWRKSFGRPLRVGEVIFNFWD